MAEHAFGFIFTLTQRIAVGNRMIKRGGGTDYPTLQGNDVQHKTVGIVGIGRIGTIIAKLCHAFEMQVLACDPYLTAEEIAARGGSKVNLDELIERPDLITLHCPRTNETLGMLGATQFARTKPNAYSSTPRAADCMSRRTSRGRLPKGGSPAAG